MREVVKSLREGIKEEEIKISKEKNSWNVYDGPSNKVKTSILFRMV